MVQWLVYTVAIGLVPMLMRFLVWWLTKFGVDAFSVPDVIAFGLVLHVSMINQVEDIAPGNERWRRVINGASIIAIIIYAIFFVFALIAEKNVGSIDDSALVIFSLVFSVISFAMGVGVVKRFTP